MTNRSCDGDACSNEGVKVPVDSKALRWGIWLAAITVVYNLAEALVSIYFGYEAESIALMGFGFDSLIEISAAVLVLWRLWLQMKGASDEKVESAEGWVHRFVGVTFFLLATYIAFEAATVLIRQEPPSESMIGIVIAALSLIIMPLLAKGKLSVATHIGSAALASEAKETIACAILSAILLAGLGLHAWFGWWWADPVAGLMMIPWLVKEGLAGIRGEGCCG